MRVHYFPVLVLACLFAAQMASGESDVYLRIEDIDGESQSEGREGWIEVLSISHGQARADGSSRSDFADIELVKQVDKATPLLTQACANGTHFREVVLDFVQRDTGADRFYRVRLSDVLVSGIDLWGEVSGTPQPLESVGLDFASIEWTYTEFDASEKPVAEHLAWWDLSSQSGGAGTIPHEDPPPVPEEFRRSARFSLLDGEGEMRGVLRWTSEAGKTYGVYYSPAPDEPFDTLVTTVPSSGDGFTSTTVDMPGRRGFFLVREVD